MIIVPSNVSSVPTDVTVAALLNGNGSNNSTTFTDSATDPTGWERVGSPVISTAQSKFGGASMYFNANGYLQATTPSRFNFGTGDWTIEFWIRLANVTNRYCIFDFHPSNPYGQGQSLLRIEVQSGTFRYRSDRLVDNRITSSTISANTWYHFALCKSNSVTRMFLDGNKTGSDYADTLNYPQTAKARICQFSDWEDAGGQYGDYTFIPTAYIDDLRITIGLARYTANFTPPGAL